MSRISPLAAAVGVAAVAAFLLGFALARATAPAHAGSGATIRPLQAGGGGVSLPHLSEAAPLPALARPASVARPAPAPAPLPPAPKPPQPKDKPPAKPVVIVGSG